MAKVAKRSQEVPEALRNKPTLNLRASYIWDAFLDLESQRQAGVNGWQALTTESISCWLAFNEIHGELAREYYFLIRKLDRHWLSKTGTKRG